jgi:hypothetical protein
VQDKYWTEITGMDKMEKGRKELIELRQFIVFENNFKARDF